MIGLEGPMAMCLARELEIEDLRNHSRELIAQLSDVWTAGVNVTPDPKRPHFYEVKHPGQLTYTSRPPLARFCLSRRGYMRKFIARQ
jgi:hypothetical protein